MKKIFILLILLFYTGSANAFSFNSSERAVKNVVLAQFKYANQCNFDKFISTYDNSYVNSDGFDLNMFSSLVKDIWNTYNNIKYNVRINDISVNENDAVVKATEYTTANLNLSEKYTGALDSTSESTYYLKKFKGKWKVVSDSVSEETTKMLYGEAKNLDIKLTVPNKIKANTEYTASLEFVPPKNMLAIASIASDKIEYPQPKTKEVFRAMPEDNILERLFISNNENVNEYIVASIGLTQTSVCDLSIKLSLTGFGYVIKRVNVIPISQKEEINEQN